MPVGGILPDLRDDGTPNGTRADAWAILPMILDTVMSIDHLNPRPRCPLVVRVKTVNPQEKSRIAFAGRNNDSFGETMCCPDVGGL